MNRTITYAASLFVIWVVGYFLIAGRGLLIPIFISLFIWNFLNTVNHGVQRLPVVGRYLPNWMTMICSLFVVTVFTVELFDIISSNVNEVIAEAPKYQQNLIKIFTSIDQRFHIKVLASFDGLMRSINVQTILMNIYGVFSTITGSAVLIAMYVVFLFIEQHYFRDKLNALCSKKKQLELVNSIVTHIVKDTQTYLGLKTLLSLVTAISSWFLMKAVGLDFSEFWALLIFFLNFIPNIGAMIATAFPALLALVQFSTWPPFFIVAFGITFIQFIVGNIIEPRFLGRSLNLSPFVILVALVFWGSIWGVLGMFLSVPITVMLMIVFGHFEATRPVAVLLSQDGNISKTYEV